MLPTRRALGSAVQRLTLTRIKRLRRMETGGRNEKAVASDALSNAYKEHHAVLLTWSRLEKLSPTRSGREEPIALTPRLVVNSLGPRKAHLRLARLQHGLEGGPGAPVQDVVELAVPVVHLDAVHLDHLLAGSGQSTGVP